MKFGQSTKLGKSIRNGVKINKSIKLYKYRKIKERQFLFGYLFIESWELMAC